MTAAKKMGGPGTSDHEKAAVPEFTGKPLLGPVTDDQREHVRAAISGFLSDLSQVPLVGSGFRVTCDASNNSEADAATGRLIVTISVSDPFLVARLREAGYHGT